jgi:tetratricopeptide (TPR) repeat protein
VIPARDSRRRLFRLGTLLTPVLFLLLVELGLRVVGFGGSHPLFIDYPAMPGVRYANPEVMRRYAHSSGAPLAAIDPFPFEAVKPEGGYRIVVQGGSSAAGFPFGRAGGLAGMLADRLEATFPERPIEVISTAMAAVNSYTLTDLVDEIIEVDPDVVLIYAGHNEFLGILGVGSALTGVASSGTARLHLLLRDLRLYQLMQAVVSTVRGLASGEGDAERRSLFAQAASGARIRYGSRAFEAGLRQFEDNMSELLEKYGQAGIPVYIGTLVSNEKDLSPFVGGPGPHVGTGEWKRLMAAQLEQRRSGDVQAARRSIEALVALDRESADAWYALGRLEHETGRPGAARLAFRRARDLDELRFRAPGAISQLIRELAERHGATVVDVEERFSASSPEAIIGDELLLEHVHPNAEGYFLLADTYYDALRRDGRIGDWSQAPSREEAERDMPITEVDRIVAGWDVVELKAGYPFSEPPQPVTLPSPVTDIERLAWRLRTRELDWLHTMEALLQMYRRQGHLEDAARVARLAAQQHPADKGPNFVAGVLLARLERHLRARLYFERSLRAAPGDAATLAALVRVERALDDDASARVHLNALTRVAPHHPLVRGSP